MKNVLLKDTVKEIKNTFKRFLSILLVVLLGVGFFAGIKATSPDMKKTIDRYFDKQNVMDIQVISTLGLTKDDIETLKNVENVENVEGSYTQDVIVLVQDKETVVKLETITDEVNHIVLKNGRMPENINECVVEESFMHFSGYNIGDSIKINAEKIKDDEGNEKELLKQDTIKIVGIVESPLYISRERGSSKLGSGKVNYYMYIPKENITQNIYTNVYVKVAGANKLACYDKKYDDLVDNVKDKIEEISDERKQARYNEIYSEANTKIQDAQKTLDREKQKSEKELKDAQTKIDNAKKEAKSGKTQLEENRKKASEEFKEAESKISIAQKELNAQLEKFNTAKEEAKKQISENQNKLTTLQNTQTQYNTAKGDLEKKQKELETLKKELDSLDPSEDEEKIIELNKKVTEISQEIYVLNMTISTIESNLTSQGMSIETLASMITTLNSGIKKAQEELQTNENKLNSAQKDLQTQKSNLEKQKQSTYAKLNSVESQLKNAEKEIDKNEQKLEKARKEANKKIEEAEEKLEEAKLKLADIKKPEWYVLDRNQNNGYASYMQDTDRIANIATVFPVVFFLVAALISLTSMSRMVEEQRVQIGTLKALGYTKIQIASKYIIYALLATTIGSAIGLAIGFNLIPKIITDMYAMMYTLPDITLEFDLEYTVISLLLAMLCTVGATIYSCTKELLSTPANLMRPKAPKPGKRVFLENIKWIWSKLKFTQKVTARNIFRYKKRFLMTIIGVMGSTALILAGFGIRDSISKMIPAQYGEIFKYNLQISLNDNITTKQLQKEVEKIGKMDEIEEIMKANIQSIEITSVENNQNIQLIIPENIEELSKFISLQSRTKKSEKYVLDNEGIILTEKLAKLLNLKAGDAIKIKNSDNVEVETKISHITENYLMHYIYMSPDLYQKLYNKEFKENTLLVNIKGDTQESKLGSKILENENVTGVLFTSSTENVFSEVMNNMNYVVWILIISAGLLAFVVLYNLANTNISERIRELATIKVLGFYDKEVYDYVSKESNILTLIGIVLGLFAGYFLAMFIIKTCELDILMFHKEINTISFVYSIIITVLFTTIVNIATYFALKKIDMIESLKSIE